MYECESLTTKKAEHWRMMFSNCGAGEDSWESLGQQGGQISQSYKKSTLNIDWKDWCWSWAPMPWPPDEKSWHIGNDPDARKNCRQEKDVTEDEMFGWHHWLNRHEFEQAPGAGYGQGSLVCCSPWSHKELDTTKWLNWTDNFIHLCVLTTLHRAFSVL